MNLLLDQELPRGAVPLLQLLAWIIHENHEGTQGTKKNLNYGEESKSSLSKLSHVIFFCNPLRGIYFVTLRGFLVNNPG